MDHASRIDQQADSSTPLSAPWATRADATDRAERRMEYRLERTLPNWRSTLHLSVDHRRPSQSLLAHLSWAPIDFVGIGVASLRAGVPRVRAASVDRLGQRNAVLVELGQAAFEVVGSLDPAG